MSTIPPQTEIIYKIQKISLAQRAGEHIKLSYMSSAKMCNHAAGGIIYKIHKISPAQRAGEHKGSLN